MTQIGKIRKENSLKIENWNKSIKLKIKSKIIATSAIFMKLFSVKYLWISNLWGEHSSKEDKNLDSIMSLIKYTKLLLLC